jgi:hypothetical protein
LTSIKVSLFEVLRFYIAIFLYLYLYLFFLILLDLSGIDYTTVQADRYQQSWMGWAFAELYNEDGTVYPAMVATISRTYLFLFSFFFSFFNLKIASLVS